MQQPGLKVFISHNHADRVLAEAWKKLLETISAGEIRVWHSSDTNPHGGVMAGKDWHEQLYQRLSESSLVIAIQTRANYDRPWVMWECGAASGVNRERDIIPIVYGLDPGEASSPLAIYQAYDGTDRARVRELCSRLAEEAGITLAGNAFARSLPVYLKVVNSLHPHEEISEVQMETWFDEFKEKVRDGLSNEVMMLRQLMYASYPEPFKPVKAELHGWLSKTLVDQEKYNEAIEEANYALSLNPNNTLWLFYKALALVERLDLGAAEELVNSIFSLNPNLRLHRDFASLAGRIHREHWIIKGDSRDLDMAFTAYHQAYLASDKDYYPGINAAELALARGEAHLAQELFAEVLQTCQKKQAQPPVNAWVDFTAGHAYLGLGQMEEAFREYQRGLGRPSSPPLRERRSAAKGCARIAALKKLPDEGIAGIRELLL